MALLKGSVATLRPPEGDNLYMIYRVRDTVRIPPSLFGKPLEEAALQVLTEKYVGYVHPDMGIIVAIFDVKVKEEGRIIPGDGATYHESEYSVLAFRPQVKEVVEGIVVNAQQYGLWVNLGPVEGFAHVTQLMDDRVVFDPQRRALIGERSRRIVEIGDVVRARVVSVSIPSEPTMRPRIQLTLRQPYLGKPEWYQKTKQESS
ncbi:DNA-directed RNA polymerase subunit E' [Pyrodictium delaneyi]|uniref:DNA-directed RNA polymerase subunit Rpo7 n=1 Tax=Pyrodictium delaneyi TaxID=1273541 RepID=A0A0N7JCS0_9CREN|nr:DNA-directed RNA polymerase [Pyrodictium delaneyi]ALL00169.1 DNA-directed RNA polymerase subunit E' [Pyrodictium delaneyi]